MPEYSDDFTSFPSSEGRLGEGLYGDVLVLGVTTLFQYQPSLTLYMVC